MSSTEKQKKILTKFFDEELVPLSGISKISVIKEKGADDYFMERKDQNLRKEDFELKLKDQDKIISSLEAIWKDSGLEKLPKKLMELAPEFADVRQSDSVSPFIYEMF